MSGCHSMSHKSSVPWVHVQTIFSPFTRSTLGEKKICNPNNGLRKRLKCSEIWSWVPGNFLLFCSQMVVVQTYMHMYMYVAALAHSDYYYYFVPIWVVRKWVHAACSKWAQQQCRGKARQVAFSKGIDGNGWGHWRRRLISDLNCYTCN